MCVAVDPDRHVVERGDGGVEIARIGPVETISCECGIDPLSARRVMRDDDRRFGRIGGEASLQGRPRCVEGIGRILWPELGQQCLSVRCDGPLFDEEIFAHASAHAVHGVRAPAFEVRPERRTEKAHAVQVYTVVVENSDAGQMLPQEADGFIKHPVIVIVVSGDEQDVTEVCDRALGKAHHPGALIDAVLVASRRIEAAGVTQITGNDEHVALRQLPLEVLGFQMQVADVVAAHDGSASRIDGAVSMGAPLRVVG